MLSVTVIYLFIISVYLGQTPLSHCLLTAEKKTFLFLHDSFQVVAYGQMPRMLTNDLSVYLFIYKSRQIPFSVLTISVANGNIPSAGERDNDCRSAKATAQKQTR